MVPGLYHQLHPNDLVNYSLACDGLQVELVDLGSTTMAVFMIFYSKMVILKKGDKTNMIIMLSMHA